MVSYPVSDPMTQCARYLQYKENILHCLRDFNFAYKNWHYVSFTDINFYFRVDVVYWIKSNGIDPYLSLFLAVL